VSIHDAPLGGASVSLAGAPLRRGVRQVNFELRTSNFERRNALTQVIFFLNEKTDGPRQCVPLFEVRRLKFEVGMCFSEVY
jgi:hypothetical protein